LAAIEFSKSIKDINQDKLAAVGFSLGAIAILYASKHQQFKALVLEGLFANSYDLGEEMLNKKIGKRLAKFVGYAIFWIGSMIWSLGKFRHSRPMDHIAQVSPTPMMIIRGKNDERVPEISFNKLLLAAGDPMELWLHDGLHTKAFNQYPDEYKQRVLKFLNKHTK